MNRSISRRVLIVTSALLVATSASAQPWQIASWWQTLPLPEPVGSAEATSVGNHLLVFASGTTKAWVGDADPLTGDVVAWRPTSGVPGAPQVDGLVTIGDHVVVPGYPESYVATLAADASIVSWTAAPGTNTAATGGRGVAADGQRVYTVGGGAPYTAFNSVEVATLDASGTLSAWQSLNPLPIVVHDPMAMVADGYLYAFGGEGTPPSGDTSHSRDVYRAAIQADGTVGSWQLVGLMLDRRPHSGYLVYDGTIHVVAGGVHSFMTSSVESALLEDFGQTSQHIWSASLPTILNEHGTATAHRFGYVMGGNNRYYGGGPQSTVYVAELGPANSPPVADAGPDLRLAADESCSALAQLDGTASYDPDGDPLSYTWTGPFGSVDGAAPSVSLPLGVSSVTLTVDDGRGGSDSDDVVVTVVDEAPPSIDTVTASPELLWPPNHKLVPVTVLASAQDNCSAAPRCGIEAVESNEPETGSGSGHFSPDWEIVDATTVLLRAERAGTGDGRIYSIHVECSDETGNTVSADTEAVVSHDGH